MNLAKVKSNINAIHSENARLVRLCGLMRLRLTICHIMNIVAESDLDQKRLENVNNSISNKTEQPKAGVREENTEGSNNEAEQGWMTYRERQLTEQMDGKRVSKFVKVAAGQLL